MRWSWTAGAALLIGLLTACRSGPPVKPVELTDFKPSVKVKEVWRSDVRDSAPYYLNPATVEGDVFSADTVGRVARFDGRKGNTKWKLETHETISAGVGVGGGMVLVGTAKGKVLAFDLKGKPKWSTQVRSEILAPPAANDKWVIVRSSDGLIYGLNAADGVKKWEFQSVLPNLILRSDAGVNLEGEYVFAGLAGGKVVALRTQDGVQLWEASIALPHGDNEVERVADVSGPPLRDQSLACLATFQGRIGCFDLDKGAGVWSREASTARALAADDRNVYMVDDRSNVFAFQRETGTPLWKQEKLYGRRLGAPLVRGAHVVVGDFQGYVHVLNTQDGNFVGRVRAAREPIRAAPVVVGQSVVVQSIGGDISALSIQ